MSSTKLHDDNFLQILWDEAAQIIGIDWKETTAGMTDEDMRHELSLFAGFVEHKRAPRIVVDVTNFRHTMSPTVQKWRLKNVSTRYNAAGVKRFAFVAPQSSATSSTKNQSLRGEAFETRWFSSRDEAVTWLTSP